MLEYADSLGHADGQSGIGSFRLRTGLSHTDEFAVVTHEFAQMIHKHDRRKQTSKTIREAGPVAFVVCQAIGLDIGTVASDGIHLYADDESSLADSLDYIQQTAAEIMAAGKSWERSFPRQFSA